MGKSFFLLSFCAVVLTACGGGNTSDKKEQQKDYTYSIVDTISRDLGDSKKCNLDIELSKKITSDEIQDLALKLREERKTCDKLYIFYRLKSMNQENTAWATSHFTPDLKVEVIGSTNETDAAAKATVVDGTVEGKWQEDQSTASTFILYKNKDSKMVMKQIFKDGKSMDENVKKEGNKIISDSNPHGEYYKIETSGELSFYNKEGKKYATGKVVK